jgi:hypothetical protein
MGAFGLWPAIVKARPAAGGLAHNRGPPMHADAQTAYLFQCGDEGLFAVSPDKAGSNIPRSSCTQGWLLRQEFQLGTQDPVPAAIGPEPILRSIIAKGYYIWRAALPA